MAADRGGRGLETGCRASRAGGANELFHERLWPQTRRNCEREAEGEKVGRALIEGLCEKEMRLGPSAWQPCPWAWPACFARVMTAVGAVC